MFLLSNFKEPEAIHTREFLAGDEYVACFASFGLLNVFDTDEASFLFKLPFFNT